MVVHELAAEGIVFEGIFTPPAYTATSFLLNGPAHREVMERYNHLACFGLMVSDTSSGRILRMPNGHALALYNLNKTDVRRFVRGISTLVDIFFAAGATKVYPGLHPLPVLTRDQGSAPIFKSRIHAKDLELQAFHPLGTCRMGADPEESVLDPHCRLYGFDNLHVLDGSIFPTSLGVNPMLTIMAASRKIAGYIGRECL
jgi:choline dehydrogenase-like flavoprotein